MMVKVPWVHLWRMPYLRWCRIKNRTHRLRHNSKPTWTIWMSRWSLLCSLLMKKYQAKLKLWKESLDIKSKDSQRLWKSKFNSKPMFLRGRASKSPLLQLYARMRLMWSGSIAINHWQIFVKELFKSKVKLKNTKAKLTF